MERLGTYYLGRVHKGGILTTDKIIEVLEQPASIKVGKFEWTITDFKRYETFFFGRLTKFNPRGQVDIVDKQKHVRTSRNLPDLIQASSPFVFLPQYMGISFLHVWNEIEQDTFVSRFCKIVEQTLNGFFVNCEIEPISDLQKFYEKIKSLENIQRINAKVTPPNPLFGHLWKNLKEYLELRALEEMKIDEKAPKKINTDIQDLIEKLNTSKSDDPIEDRNVSIGDAAVLMAADGYGKASIEGMKGNKKVIIRTRETMKSFNLKKEPDPVELGGVTKSHLEEINQRRHLEH